MPHDIKSSLTELAEDEGKQHALDTAQDLQQSLETLMECGSTTEQALALQLLASVNSAIGELIQDCKL